MGGMPSLNLCLYNTKGLEEKHKTCNMKGRKKITGKLPYKKGDKMTK
jgi:hypothetical protein